MKKIYWDNSEIGHGFSNYRLPPISRSQIAQFVSLTSDFSPLYVDEEFAKDAGLTSVFAPNSLALALIDRAILNFAENVTILSMSATFERLIWPQDSLFAQGLVLRRYDKNQEYRVLISLWCINQREEVIMRGSSTCILFKNPNHEKEAQLLKPEISTESKKTLQNKILELRAKKNNAPAIKTPSPKPEFA